MQVRSTQLGRDFPLRVEGTTLIGRNPECAILLQSEETAISRKHAEIRVEGERVAVRDLGSRNGTRLNGRRLPSKQWHSVRALDQLSICDFDFVFIEERQPDPNQGSCRVVPGEPDSSNDTSSVSLSSQSLPVFPADDRLAQLRSLLRVTEALAGILETEDVIARTAAILLDIFPAVERSAIGFLDPGGRFEPRWWHLRNQDASGEIQISQTVVDFVRSNVEAVLTNDAGRKFPEAESVYSLSLRSIMCAPLLDSNGQVSGMLHVDAQQPNRFSPLDLQVLATVAAQVSLAVEYSKLHEEVVRDRILVHDLERARAVQQQYLPDSSPSLPGYEIAGFYRAAREVGGDYYDYIPLPDGRLALVLGDVEGKGAPAALTMVKLATETQAGVEICESAAKLVTRLNQRMFGSWITYVAIYLDPTTHRLDISNAGHEYPLLRHPDGQVHELALEETRGTPLSVVQGIEYQQETIELQPGEMLVLYSDGFSDTEAGILQPENERQKTKAERFGKQRIIEILSDSHALLDEFSTRLIQDVDTFRDGHEQFDDMCLICLRRM